MSTYQRVSSSMSCTRGEQILSLFPLLKLDHITIIITLVTISHMTCVVTTNITITISYTLDGNFWYAFSSV